MYCTYDYVALRKIKMLPKAIPDLTEEQFTFLKKEMERKPSKKDIQRIERVKKLFNDYPL